MPDANRPEVTADELVDRWPMWRPFLVVGATCVTAGGIVAAVSRPTAFDLGPWTAAFLVLVGGVAQIALGTGQAWLLTRPPAMTRVRLEAGTWNLGVAATLLGTWTTTPVLTTLGGLSLAGALAWFIATTAPIAPQRRWSGLAYRALASIVLLSIPVGLGLAWIRH